MPKYLPVNAIRDMEYTELERWWEVDFDVLTATAVAEATGDVQPSVAEALRSDDWLEQWTDALYAASGGLGSSVERMEYTGNGRTQETKQRFGQVHLRLGHAHRLLRSRLGEQGWELLHGRQKDAREASLAILARHYIEESQQLAQDEIARRGLPPRRPFWNEHRETPLDAIEGAVRRGTIHAPVTPEVTSLLRLPARVLTHLVAADTHRQEDRCAELRHPLLLRGWVGALEHLRDRHCELADMKPEFTVSPPRLDMRELRAMNSQDAWTIINRRRFIRSLAQRRREYQMHLRELSRAASVREEEIKKPWLEATLASREELARRHPRQLKALMAAFQSFCVPGSTEIRRECLTGEGKVKVNVQVVPMLKRALVDGTWRNLLDEPASEEIPEQRVCPGEETEPNRCTCGCEGCLHNCAACQAKGS